MGRRLAPFERVLAYWGRPLRHRPKLVGSPITGSPFAVLRALTHASAESRSRGLNWRRCAYFRTVFPAMPASSPIVSYVIRTKTVRLPFGLATAKPPILNFNFGRPPAFEDDAEGFPRWPQGDNPRPPSIVSEGSRLCLFAHG